MLVVLQMALEARKAILRLLETGPKTGEELRREYLGERPETSEKQREYDTKYQAFRRALDSLVEDGSVEEPKYHLVGEVANRRYVTSLIQHFEKTTEPAKQTFLMEDIEAECKKREAIAVSGLLIFLKKTLDNQSAAVRKLAVRSLRNITSRIDEFHRDDSRYLKRLREDHRDKLLDIASQDPSIEVRIEALDLLLELGEIDAIHIFEDVILGYPTEIFVQFKSLLEINLCNPYNAGAFSKNRFLRDHKNNLRIMLMDLRLRTDNPRIQKRAELVSWKLRHGPSSTMPGEGEID